MELEDLRKVSILADLSDGQLELIRSIVITRSYHKGEFIFHEGEVGVATYFLLSGVVKISTGVADGREKILHLMRSGMVFGEVVLFDAGPYPATAEVVEDAQVGMLRNEDLFALLHEHADLSIGLLRLLARRLRMAQRQVRGLALKDTPARVAELILRLAEEEGVEKPQGTYVPLSVTRQELASMAGTTRETLTRILAGFAQEGIIDLQRRGMLILDSDSLRMISEEA